MSDFENALPRYGRLFAKFESFKFKKLFVHRCSTRRQENLGRDRKAIPGTGKGKAHLELIKGVGGLDIPPALCGSRIMRLELASDWAGAHIVENGGKGHEAEGTMRANIDK